MRKHLLWALGAASVLSLAAACGQSVDPSTPQDEPGQTVTVHETVTESVPPTESAPSSESFAGVEIEFAMPDEVGNGLQFAQDHLQEVSGNPLYYSESVDATGAGRAQIVDSNWKVCAQNVPAGSPVRSDIIVTFSAVKLSETCP